MNAGVDALATPSIVAILDGEEIRGTGFVIDDDGGVITCHHVVDGLTSLGVRGADGAVHDVAPDRLVLAPDIDLALIRLPVSPGPALPLGERDQAQSSFWTKGFHRVSLDLPQGFPVAGRITGSTAVHYAVATEYHIEGALVLKGDLIDHGLSGAPLLDPQTNVVVGVVNTRLTGETGGFAIPFNGVARASALAAAIEHNRRSVAAWGVHFNLPALQELCAAVTMSSVEWLATARHVDLDRRITRGSVERAAALLTAEDRVLALVGPSGVGKSTEISAMAIRESPLSILLRGSEIKAPSTGLSDRVEQAMRAVAGNRPLPDDLLTQVSRLAANHSSPVVVLVDALNETALDWQALQDWVANSNSWVRQLNARLVLTTRPETWDVIQPALGRALVQQVAAFDDEERAAAQRVYNVRHLGDGDLSRLPLAFALSARADGGLASPLASLDDLIDALLHQASVTAAVTAGSRIPPAGVRMRLQQVAAKLVESDSDHLLVADADALFGGPALAESLIAEGIFARTTAGYRFVYDDVADRLKAGVIDLESELNNLDSRTRRHAGGVASALRDLGRQGSMAELAGMLNLLVTKVQSGESASTALHLVEETLLKMEDAEPLLPTLRALVRTPLTDFHGNAYHNIAFWRSVPVSTPVRLGLVRELVPDAGYLGWRAKDWDRAVLTDAWYSPAALALAICDEDAAALDALGPWFDDQHWLKGGEATVADVALGILYRLRHRHAESVWQVLDRFADATFPVWRRIAENEPRWFISRLVQTRHDALDELYVPGLYWLRWSQLADDESLALVAELEQRYRRGLPNKLIGTALVLLDRHSADAEYRDELVDAYRNERYGVTAWEMVRLAGESATRALTDAVLTGGAKAEDAISALRSAEDADLQNCADEAVLAFLVNGTGELNFTVTLYAEDRMWHSAVASPPLMALMRYLIGNRDVEWTSSLASVLISPSSLSDDRASQSELLAEYLATADASRTVSLLDAAINEIRHHPPRPELLAVMSRSMQLVDPDVTDTLFVWGAGTNDRLESMLGGWLAEGTLPSSGPWLRSLRDRVLAGEGATAAFEAVREEWQQAVLGD